MNPRRLLTAAVLAACLVTLGAAQSDEDGQPAPRFNARTTAGEKFSNESVKGKVVLLQFWATWCKYCRADQSTVDAIDKEFAPQGLLTLAVDVGEDKKIVKRYLDQYPRSCRVVLTSDTNLAAMYAANAYPIYVVIDRDGKIAAERRGAIGERGLLWMLRQAGLEVDKKSD